MTLSPSAFFFLSLSLLFACLINFFLAAMTKKINPEEYYYNPFESSSIICHDKPLNGSKRCHQTWTSDLEQRMMVEKGSSNKNIIVAGSDDNYDDEHDKDENESSWKSILFSTEIVPPIKRSVLWPVVFTYSVAVLLFALMSGELMMNHELSGEFFEFEPLNEMLGPSLQTLIQSGARFPPCMIQTTLSPDDLYVCFRLPYDEPKDGQAGSKGDDNRPETFDQDLVNEAFALANSADAVQSTCTLEQVCGMGGFANSTVPDQTFRFLTPLFVHAGLIQFLIHLAFLAVLARELEKIMNGVRLAIAFFASGMFGNLFGASFASLTASAFRDKNCSMIFYLVTVYVSSLRGMQYIHPRHSRVPPGQLGIHLASDRTARPIPRQDNHCHRYVAL